jgi:proto-oncogene tyrosine-protein kinase Met
MQIWIGKNLVYDVGFLKYTMKEEVSEGSLSVGILALLVILVLIILAIIALLIVMKMRRMGPFRDKNEERFRYVHGQGMMDAEGQRLMDQNRQNGIGFVFIQIVCFSLLELDLFARFDECLFK